jgi:translation initiation factor 2 subunit 2
MTYDENLDRALAESPDIERTEGRFELPDPVVRTEGNVTVYENFPETVERLDREPGHVMKVIQTDLGTSANIDDAGRLRLTGEFKQSRLQSAIEDYADGYVLCPECGLPDTRLERVDGALLRRCEACGARSATGT